MPRKPVPATAPTPDQRVPRPIGLGRPDPTHVARRRAQMAAAGQPDGKPPRSPEKRRAIDDSLGR